MAALSPSCCNKQNAKILQLLIRTHRHRLRPASVSTLLSPSRHFHLLRKEGALISQSTVLRVFSSLARTTTLFLSRHTTVYYDTELIVPHGKHPTIARRLSFKVAVHAVVPAFAVQVRT
ncbi:hypothetical protein A0H81_07884 [Grifola frondosa]|uniref:Uncharacterized protein n=1 Tax=Grifola frondosa TaxID=5627 RepID=A0A1C7M796_GRIFR|nr:hypothetical protein A0H81_07884 [Grifola frondosa]